MVAQFRCRACTCVLRCVRARAAFARSAARWKCLLLAILLGTCSISIIVSLPSRPAARGKAALLASTAADVEPEASLSHVAPASSADVDGFVIPPPCLSVMAVTALSGTALLVSLTAAVPAMGFQLSRRFGADDATGTAGARLALRVDTHEAVVERRIDRNQRERQLLRGGMAHIRFDRTPVPARVAQNGSHQRVRRRRERF